MPIWISQDTEFQKYIASLPAGSPVAIDTEFEWTRTYYPRLALLQMAVDKENCALVDPFTITDWSPLRTLLTDPARIKVVFSGKNDLPILVRTCGGYENCRPAAVADLQIAMGFCGHAANASLKSVMETIFQITLDKSETRSDWTQRPLTAQQLAYAADDVVLLPEAFQRIVAQMRQHGNYDCFLEEMQLFGQAELYTEADPSLAWRRIGGYRRIRGELPRTRIRALAKWREETAQANDLSRNRLLPDEALIRLALSNAITPAEIMRLPRIVKPIVKRFQNDILSIHSHPVAPPELPEPQNPLNTPARKAYFNQHTARILSLIRQRAEARHIDSTLLGARHDAEALVLQTLQNQPIQSRLLTGWRAAILQPIINDILE
ncbi:MAG: HRDC domain-containing protein, partial [Victivallales bacterium]|nr:HRDC domain-containing protein [Victivallales bacterium]